MPPLSAAPPPPPPCHQHLGWSPPCLTSVGCPTLQDEGGRVPSAPGEVVPSASFPPAQPRTPTLPSFSQDLIPCRHSGSVPEEPRAQKAAAWVDSEDSKLTQSHCGWKHCYRLWCITSQSRETPRMTSRFPWKVRTRRNPRGRQWGPPGEGSPAWHPGLGEREQGAGQKEAGSLSGRRDWGVGPLGHAPRCFRSPLLPARCSPALQPLFQGGGAAV